MDSFFLESTFKDQINPKRQTAGPREGGSPELDLAAWTRSAETTRIVCDFSAADGLPSRRARWLQARRATADAPETRVEATGGCQRACRLGGRPCSELAGREDTAANGP